MLCVPKQQSLLQVDPVCRGLCRMTCKTHLCFLKLFSTSYLSEAV